MIISNKARCKKCGIVVESRSVHDFQGCRCGNIFVDGGHDYLRRGAEDFSLFEELSEESGASLKGTYMVEYPVSLSDGLSDEVAVAKSIEDRLTTLERLVRELAAAQYAVGGVSDERV